MTWVALAAGCVLGTLAPSTARAVAPGPPPAFVNLDWSAPALWVHVDNVDASKAGAFESARKGWKRVLVRDGRPLGDGRPLFWHARSSVAGQTYFTFYPFRAWSDLDARLEMIERTVKIVGEAAAQAYDAGDDALVSPHYSQIWRRLPDYDVVGDASRDSTELTAAAGRLELHAVDIRRWDEFERAWKEVARTLARHRYPLAARAFMGAYGRGEIMIWWMAGDADAYRTATPLPVELERHLGREAAATLTATLASVFPQTESYEIVRRPDLSHLGR